MKFNQFVTQLRRINPAITQSQAQRIWEAFLPFPIQAAIEERIAFLGVRSLNLNGDPYGPDDRIRSNTQHWVVYQGSSFSDSSAAPLPGQDFSQTRTLEFQHYVEVEDLRRDYEQALLIHEVLMSLLAGFCPSSLGARGALRCTDDGVVSARDEGKTVYRYRATYRIEFDWRPASIPALLTPGAEEGELFTPTGITVGLFRSPVDQAGDLSVSTKFADIEVRSEDGSPSQ